MNVKHEIQFLVSKAYILLVNVKYHSAVIHRSWKGFMSGQGKFFRKRNI